LRSFFSRSKKFLQESGLTHFLLFTFKLIDMKKLTKRLVVTRDDYTLLNSLLNSLYGRTAVDRKNAEELRAELKKADIVSKDRLPEDVVRLNSKVTIKADGDSEAMELTLVTPDRANIKEKKISVLAPVGTALIGFRRGQKVKLQVPAGPKTFTILGVSNAED
jgi:regulator of nucleoside diphosphate kinase